MDHDVRPLPNGDFEVTKCLLNKYDELREQRYTAVQNGNHDLVTKLDDRIFELLKKSSMSVSFLLFLIMVSMMFYTYGNWLGYYSLLFNGKVYSKLKQNWGYNPKITVLLSSYNEGKDVYDCIKSIMASNYPKHLIEIIGIDDKSMDDTFDWMLRAQEEHPDNVRVSQNVVNSGKPTNLVNLAKQATGEIYLSIDSDTIVDVNAIRELVSCFSSPDIGAVGAQIRVRNLNDSIFSQYQGLRYVTQFYFLKAVENQSLSSRCLYGPMVAYRGDVYQQLIKLVPDRNFLGAMITYGEDTYLTTSLCIGRGVDKPYKVFNNLKAVAWTGQPASGTKYMNQQMRWWRGCSVNALSAIYHLFFNITKMETRVSALLIVLVPFVVRIAGLVMFIYLGMVGELLDSLMILILWASVMGLVECLIYNILVGYKDGVAGPLKNPVLLGFFSGLWMPVVWILLPVVSLFTLDDPGWVTRQNVSNV